MVAILGARGGGKEKEKGNEEKRKDERETQRYLAHRNNREQGWRRTSFDPLLLWSYMSNPPLQGIFCASIAAARN